MINDSKQISLKAMNVTWSPEDLELYENRVGLLEAAIFTTAKIMILAMAVVTHRTFYKMMKRLPGRAINQILYPHMVSMYYVRVKVQIVSLIKAPERLIVWIQWLPILDLSHKGWVLKLFKKLHFR